MENRPIYTIPFLDLIFDQNVADSFMELTRHPSLQNSHYFSQHLIKDQIKVPVTILQDSKTVILDLDRLSSFY